MKFFMQISLVTGLVCDWSGNGMMGWQFPVCGKG